jgi:hypothetical protein
VQTRVGDGPRRPSPGLLGLVRPLLS